MPTQEKIASLIIKYLQQNITEAGRKELEEWINQSETNRSLFEELTADRLMGEVKEFYDSKKIMDEKINAAIPGIWMETLVRKMPFKRREWRYAAAAIIILAVGAGGYLAFDRVFTGKGKVTKIETREQRYRNDVPPGSDGAILTLADGKKIVLDSVQNGAVTEQGKVQVIKKGGRITYAIRQAHREKQKGGKQNEVLYNIMTTERGKQYQLVLADGSKVWLNAASSVRFPAAFTGDERIVEITGEVYFEVVPLSRKGEQDKMPFIVKIATPSGRGIKIQVLGTQFNINAYGDEAMITTTLLGGIVQIQPETAKTATLQPGQQAQISTPLSGNGEGEVKVLNDANLEEAVAWKNGYFRFYNAPIESIMRQVARWYDVEVMYEGKISQPFIGKIPRNVNISALLEILEATGWVHFKIVGRKITVMP